MQRHNTKIGKEALQQKQSVKVASGHHLWAHPKVPVHLSHFVSMQEQTIPLTSIGFADPNSPARHSPVLQQQMALLNANKDVDYFLFDEAQSCLPHFVCDHSKCVM